MREILTRLSRHYYWNRCTLDEQRLREICKREGIRIAEGILPERGIYMVLKNGPLIGLDSCLTAFERWRVLGHELGHHFLHTPGMWMECSANELKLHFQANVFCAGALIPQPYIRNLSFMELEHEFLFPRDLIMFRADLWRTHRI